MIQSNLEESLLELKELIENFNTNIEDYKLAKYDESNTRTDFIDKFFGLLGWDINNEQGYSEDFRDVIREDKVVIQGKPKSPDYSFKIGRERQFFVEAKKPSVNINLDSKPAFQLRRYAYTAGLPISILTNFEEFAIYDSRIKPDENDKASSARIFYCKFNEYEKHWEFLNNTISKQAVLKGNLKRYSEDNTKKKGTQSVDKELLKLIESWRFDLAKNISQRNKDIDIYNLNEAVQIIIDRIIFLRMAEDRNTEIYGFLHKISDKKNIFSHLIKYCDSANRKYNSGLFASNKWLEDLIIDDKIFKTIIHDLYYPMPYEFSVLPIEILGQIYEQFLGKTIVLSSKHVASIEEKPEVRKAGGVYYTPKYIVDYIIENTLGNKVIKKSPKEIEKIKILDPSCGSGSFLVVAYKYLLDFHLNYYSNNGNIKKSIKEGKIYEAGFEDFRLTIREKKKILLNNIFGVDIDKQAVEVTKLSLLLTLMEGEIVESRSELFLKSISEALLPNLDENIKCGNSLIGTDFYYDKDLLLFDKHEQRKINCFDWPVEFKDIIKSGGFDVVIGNPPYVRIQNLKEFNKNAEEFISSNFKSATKGNYDLYVIFLEKALKLINQTGMIGYILPHKFFNSGYGEPIRRILSNGNNVNQIVYFNDNQIFDNATTYTCLLFLDKEEKEYFKYVNVLDLKKWISDYKADEGLIETKYLSTKIWNFNINPISSVFDKINKIPIKLGDISKIFVGLQTSADSIYILELISINKNYITVFSKSLNQSFEIEKGITRPLLKGSVIRRYGFPLAQKIILFPYKQTNESMILLSDNEIKKEFPKAWNYLISVKKKLKERENGKFKVEQWWQFGRNQNIFEMSKKKILTQVLANQASFTFDKNGDFCFVGGGNAGGYGLIINRNLKISDFYLIGLLNSKLLDLFVKNISTTFKGGYFSYAKRFIEQLPIKSINFKNKSEKTKHDQIVSLVEQMLETQKEAQDSINQSDSDKKLLNQRNKILDKKIDNLVYELYDLTIEEIKIIEEN